MLRKLGLFGSLSLLLHAASSEPAPSAGAQPLAHAHFITPSTQRRPLLLFKRQSCPTDHTSCASLSAPEACCPSGTTCARDQRGNIACCPNNNYCTGTLGETALSTGSGSQATSYMGGYVGTVTVTSTAGVTAPITPAPSATGIVAGGGSTLPNAYYPFVYLPTSFGNAGICLSYYTSCQTASTACFQSLAGINGVTIGGMGMGTTQAGSSGILQASASSICSSLSQTACYGLQSTQCSQFGSTGGSATGFIQVGKGTRETGCPGLLYVAAAGAAVGAMGMAV